MERGEAVGTRARRGKSFMCHWFRLPHASCVPAFWISSHESECAWLLPSMALHRIFVVHVPVVFCNWVLTLVLISTWDFSATTAASSTDTKTKDAEVDNNPWSLNRSKPKKKTTDFAFGSLDEEEGNPDEPDPPAGTKADEGFDFGFSSGKKDKKKKGGVFDFQVIDEEPKEELAPAAGPEDEWGSGWGTAQTKKKGKKGAEPQPPKEEPKVEDPAPVEGDWAMPSSKKDKKKKGKNAVEEPVKASHFS